MSHKNRSKNRRNEKKRTKRIILTTRSFEHLEEYYKRERELTERKHRKER